MSLVNDMLKDLEARKVNTSGAGGSAGMRPVHKRGVSRVSVLLISVFVVLSVLVWMFWPKTSQFAEAALRKSPDLQPPTLETPKQPDVRPVNNDGGNTPATPTPAGIEYQLTWYLSDVERFGLKIRSSIPLGNFSFKPNESGDEVRISLPKGRWLASQEYPEQWVAHVSRARTDEHDEVLIRFVKAVRVTSQIEAAGKGERLVLGFYPKVEEVPVTPEPNALTSTGSTDERVDNKPAVQPLKIRREPRLRPEVLLEEATTAYHGGDYQRVVDTLLRIRKLESLSPDATLLLASSYLQLDRVGEAKNLLANLERTNQAKPDVQVLLARIELSEGRQAEALALLEKAQSAEPTHIESLALLGVLYQEANEPKKAVEAYSMLVQLQPSNGAWWLGLGIGLDQQMAQQDAVLAYKRALALGGVGADAKAYVRQRLSELE